MDTRYLITFLLPLIFLANLVSSKYKRICYYTNWSQYRFGAGKFLPSDIDPFLCTHIIYAFGKLEQNEVKKLEYNDYDLYGQINDLKVQNPSLKTMLALGGWTAGSVVYSEMVQTPASRAQFVQSSIRYLRTWNFDGLDMDWEYPANRGGLTEDKEKFGLLIKELREAFDAEARNTGSERLLLSAAVAAGKSTIDTAYDVPVMAQYMDFINIMSYDLHGSWESITGHNSPLFPRSNEYWDQRYLNIEYAANYWHSLGASKDKLIIGLATYGRTFTLSGPQTGIGAATRGPGIQGTYTAESGFMSYYEVCGLQGSGKGWTVYDNEQMVPYYTDGSLWVGFDDEISIAIKIEWLVSQGYGGAMVWSLDLDDFKQSCSKSSRKYPLLNVIKRGLESADNGLMLTTPVLPTGASSAAPVPTVQQTTVQGGYDSTFSCVGKPKGLYPDNADCSRYYQCDSGRVFHMNCPINLLYNSVRKYCDYPSNVVCSTVVSTQSSSSLSSSSILTTTSLSTSRTTLKTTTEQMTSSTLKSVSISQASSTSSATTSSQTKTTVQSTSSTAGTTAATPPSSTSNTQTISPREFCQSKSFGFYPNPNDCSKYYQCYDGGAVVSACPMGLLWNQKIMACDWPQNVDCNSVLSDKTATTFKPTTTTPRQSTTTSKVTLPVMSTTPQPSTITTRSETSTTFQDTSDFCRGKEDGNYPHTTDCSKYITCVRYVTYIRGCPFTLYWNPKTGNCDWQQNVVCTV